MQVTLADVVSLNGKITKGDGADIHSWTSTEDWRHFQQLRESHDVIIIDRKTYEAVQPPAEKNKLRIVFTSTPEVFADVAVAGQLEFVSIAPSALMERLSREGYKKVLLAGGSRLSSDFFVAGLIDDVYMTFEPVLFGRGQAMLAETGVDIALELQAVSRLNERGTLLAHYRVVKSKDS